MRKKYPVTPALLWLDLFTKSTEMLWASSYVVTQRLQRMAAAGAAPAARDRAEMARMVPEKVDAAMASAAAVARRVRPSDATTTLDLFAAMVRNGHAFASLAQATTPTQFLARQARLAHTMTAAGAAATRSATRGGRLAQAAMTPVHATVTRNAKRLRRTRG